MLLGISRDEAAIGEHHINTQQVVDCQAQCTRELADASAQGQSADASGGHKATWRGQPEGMGGMIHIAPGAAAFHANRARRRNDANPPHAREVDHQAIIAGTQGLDRCARHPARLASVRDHGQS